MATWTNLHQHTVYSMLDGYAKLEKLAMRAKHLGMTHLSITDHGNIHGWLKFYDACVKYGITPIFGEEFYQARKTRFDRDEEERAGPAKYEWQQRGPYHLTVLARNDIGYRNIIKMSSRAYLEGFYVKPRMDHDLLAEHSEGVIVVSGCLNGELQQALMRDDFNYALKMAGEMQDIVGKENYYVEIQDHGLEEQRRVKEGTLEIARQLGAPVVATGDCHYVEKDDHYIHDLMLCIQTGATVSQEGRFKFAGPEFHLKSYEEMEERFDPEWLENTNRLAESVENNLSFDKLYFPDVDLPEGETPDSHLEKISLAGLKERYGDPIPNEVMERAKHELGVVERMGFASYFLVVEDLVREAKSRGIRVGWGRGSAAGSILSYALKITGLDPLKFGLLFERFLVEGRNEPPDFDIDFDDRYRREMIDYAKEKHGIDKVCEVCTFSSNGARASLRDANRILEYPYANGDKLANLVPPPVLGVSKTLDECMELVEMQAAYKESEDNRRVIDAARGLEGIYRQTGVHAAAVLITQGPAMDHIPLMTKVDKESGERVVVSQWDKDDVERCGQLKIDFLGLRNLAVVDDCVEHIKNTQGIELDLDTLPLDDPLVYKALQRGDTIGVFQIESPGMTEMTVEVRPEAIEDIMAILSLYRPGPLEAGAHKLYINRKHGREEVTYPHHDLQETLEASRGIMLYQEDVISVSRILAGFTVSEADKLRKVIGKKLMKEIPLYRTKFVEDSKRTKNIPEAQANKIYDDIEKFGGYGFNKSHAAGYAMMCYVTAYLKVHHPIQYMTALLTSVGGKKERLTQYLNECRRMGIEVLPPSINKAETSFTIEDDKIHFGILGIDGIGDKVAELVMASSKDYTTLYDFFRRCDPYLLHKSRLEHLFHAGVFDELGVPVKTERLPYEKMLQVLELERKELGAYVTTHPLFDLWDYLEQDVTHTIAAIADQGMVPENVKIGGIITAFRPHTTKAGKKMYFATIEDLTGVASVIVFPNVAKKIDPELLKPGSLGILHANVARDSEEQQEVKLFYNHFVPMDPALLNSAKPIYLTSKNIIHAQQIDVIQKAIAKTEGESEIFLETPIDKAHKVVLKFKDTTDYTMKEHLEELLRVQEVSNFLQ